MAMMRRKQQDSKSVAAVEEWRTLCESPTTTEDELVTLAVLALEEGLDSSSSSRRGTTLSIVAQLLKTYAQRTRDPWAPPHYVRCVAWSLSGTDPYLAAALRLHCHKLPSMPSYAKSRLVREAAAEAASLCLAWPLQQDDDDASSHSALLAAAQAADVDALRRLMAPPRGYRRAAFKCAATGRTALHVVASAEDRGRGLLCAESLLGAGAEPAEVDDHGITPMHLAAGALWPELVQSLAYTSPEASSQKDDSGRNPLHHACAGSSKGGLVAIAKILGSVAELATSQDKFGETPLRLAVRNEEFVRLVVAECNGEKKQALFAASRVAAQIGAVAVLEILLPKEGLSELLAIVLSKSVTMTRSSARVLLQAGADPNAAFDGSRPLSRAANRGDPALCRLLLDRGAKVTSVRSDLRAMKVSKRVLALFEHKWLFPNNEVPFYWSAAAEAAFAGHPEAAAAIVERSRSKKELLGGSSWTLSVVTASLLSGHPTADLLAALDGFEDVEDPGFFQTRPLMLAACLGDCKAVKSLLARGCEASRTLLLEPVQLKEARLACETATSLLNAGDSKAREAEKEARRRTESQRAFEARVMDARAHLENLDYLWTSAEKKLSEEDLSQLQRMHRGDSILSAVLIALGEESGSMIRNVTTRSLLNRRRVKTGLLYKEEEWAREAVAQAATEAEGRSMRGLAAWLRAVSSQAVADAASAADPGRDSLSRVVLLRLGREFALQEQAAALKLRARLEGGPKGQISAVTAALKATALRGDVRGPPALLSEISRRAETVRLLANAGADLDCIDDLNKTALSAACDRGYWALAAELVRYFNAQVIDSECLESAASAAAVHAPGAALLFRSLIEAGASCRTASASRALATLLDAHCADLASLVVKGGGRLPQDYAKKKKKKAVLRGPSHASSSSVVLEECLRVAHFAKEAAIVDSKHRVELQISAPLAEYYCLEEGSRVVLRVLDKAHPHRGLVIVAEDNAGKNAKLQLEDGSLCSLEDLASEPRLYWQLSRSTSVKEEYTALHAAAACGADAWTIGAILKRTTCSLAKSDASGRTPLGVAMRRGRKISTLALLSQEEEEEEAESDDELDFEGLFLRPSERFLQSRSRAARLVLPPVDYSEARRCAECMAAANGVILSARAIAELWAPDSPQLASAELCRVALRELALPASAFGDDAKKTLVRSTEELCKMLPLPALTRLVAVLRKQGNALEATLSTCHCFFHHLEEHVEEEESTDGVPSTEVLAEVEDYWRRKTRGKEKRADFLELWRTQPESVMSTLRAAKGCLGWLRKLATARCLAMLCNPAHLDHALFELDEKRRSDDEVREAKRVVGQMRHASRRLQAARNVTSPVLLRCVDLVHVEAWTSLAALTDLSVEYAELRRETVKAITCVLEQADGTEKAAGRLLSRWAGGGLEDVTEPALELLHRMRDFHYDELSPSSRSALEQLQPGLRRLKEQCQIKNEHGRCIQAMAFWALAAAKTALDRHVEEQSENLLCESIRAFEDEDIALKVVESLGPHEAARLAVRPFEDTTALAMAASKAPKCMQALLELGTDAALCENLLRRALESKATETALLTLLAANPDAAVEEEQEGVTLLELAAASYYRPRLMHALLTAGASACPSMLSKSSPLHAAAAEGDAGLAERLIASIVAARGPNAARLALARPLYNEQDNGEYPIHVAIRSCDDDGEVLELLLGALRDPVGATFQEEQDDELSVARHYRDTPLGRSLVHDACRARKPRHLRSLVRHGGFDVDLRIGKTPLEIALERNCAGCVTELVSAGCALDSLLLHATAVSGSCSSATALLTALLTSDERCDLNVADSNGETMLHAACRRGSVELASLLLQNGAKITLSDKFGSRAIHYAIGAGQKQLTSLLGRFFRDYDVSATVLARYFRRITDAAKTKRHHRDNDDERRTAENHAPYQSAASPKTARRKRLAKLRAHGNTQAA